MMLLLRKLLNRIGETIRQQDVISFVVVFVSIFVGGKIGQYLFITYDTSPAVIWPPAGIALAAIFLGGYRMWLPVLLGDLLIYLTLPNPIPLPVSLTASVSYMLSGVLGAYALKYLGWDGELRRTRDAIAIVALSLFLSCIGPAMVVAAQVLTHSLVASPWALWSRNWAGRVMSIIVLTPLITTWFKYRKSFRWNVRALLIQKPFEASAAFVFFGLTIYGVFWTALPQVNVFVILYVLLGGLFWIALRLGPRMTATALFFMAAAGIAGTIIANPTHAHLNTQLLADELFTVLLAPLFLVLAALVEERRVTANELNKNVAELHEAMQKLETEDRSKNEFIATLAHELRNPLAPVVSTLEILKLREHEPESLSLINGAQEQMATMRKLLDDLLDVTRVTRGSFQIEKAAVELQSAMHQSVRTVEPFMWQQEHSLSVSLPSKPIWIFGDPVRISQICTNILYNAAKYTPPGGKISLNVLERGSDAMLTITDNGIGIPQDRLESIFEPFNQGQGDKRSSVGSGLGIGLSLTRHLVGLHNGTIEALSKGMGHGSTFIVYLPMYVNNEVPMPQVENKDALAILPPSSSRRILVVDDNQAAAHGLEKLLTYKGYTVDVVYDGESALKEASVFAPDVVLLDIGLPGMDGYEVARRLIKEDGSIPSLIAITGYGQEEDKRKAFEAGFNYHLTKPVGIAEIENILVSL